MTKVVFRLFIFVLIFSPLAFGTVEPWSLTIMETLCCLSFFFLLLGKLHSKEMFFYETPGIIPLLCLLILIAVQLVPLPAGIVRIISPETYNIYRGTISRIEPMPWLSLAINKKAALSEFFRIASYVIFYTITIQLLSRKDLLKKTVTVLIIFASLFSLFAILQHILPNNKIYWLRRLTQGGAPFGSYVNRNHYAGLMEMFFPLGLSLFLLYKPRITHKSLRDKITELFNTQATNVYILLGLSAVLIATSIFLTLSRGAIVSMCLSMIIFGVLFLSRGANDKRTPLIIFVFVLIILSVGWFGWAPIVERFESAGNTVSEISGLRVDVWKDSSNIVKDFPLTGAGFGGFVDIYPKYRTVLTNTVIDHAHNDYIELLAEGGVSAFLICMWFLIILFHKSYGMLKKRHEQYSIYLLIACITGMISILIHSFTDFNLRIGANGLYLFFLAGLAVSAAHTRLRHGPAETYLKKTRLPLKGTTALTALVLLGSLGFNSGITAGQFYLSSLKDIKSKEKISRGDLMIMRNAAHRASFFDPLEAEYHCTVADIERRLMDKDAALSDYIKAVQLNPVNSDCLGKLGLVMSEFKKYELADKLLQVAIAYDPVNPAVYRRYGLWLFSAGKINDGLKTMKAAMSLEPRETRQYVTLMVLKGLSDEEILNSLPERVEPHLYFADYLSRTGKGRMADVEYSRALQFITREPVIKPEYYYAVCRYLIEKNRLEDASNVMLKAIKALPNDAGIRIHAADLYEKRGLSYKAIEEYREAIVIYPPNHGAKKKLDNLLLKLKRPEGKE
jgi:O-antigen ligase/Tfp pilus assembly protein PilF